MFFETHSIQIWSQNRAAVRWEILPPTNLTEEKWFSRASWFTLEVKMYDTSSLLSSLSRLLTLFIETRMPDWKGCWTNFPLLFRKYMLVVTSSILSSTSSWSFSWIPVIVIGFNPTWGRGKHKLCRGLIGNENAWLGLNINYQLLLFLAGPTIVGIALDLLMCVFVFCVCSVN